MGLEGEDREAYEAVLNRAMQSGKSVLLTRSDKGGFNIEEQED